MITAGVIGYGYWGPNLVRNFAEAPGVQVAMVSDLRRDRLALAAARWPGIETVTDYRMLLADRRLNAVAVATPVSSHFEIVLAALQAGKHVLVEKPLAGTADQATRLIDEASRRQLVLMVDHTFVYTGAVRKIRELVATGELGDIYYYDAVRINLGLFQSDVNVIWDLAVHDLSVMDYVLDHRPAAVAATALAHFPGKPENIAYLTVSFPERIIGHIHVNWLAPVKVRRTLIAGSRRMIVYDELETSEKVRLYDRGVSLDGGTEDFYNLLVGYRMGDMLAPRLDYTEALQTEIRHFVDCIDTGRRPITDGEAGLRIVRLLEAASQSLVEAGRPVEVKGRPEPPAPGDLSSPSSPLP